MTDSGTITTTPYYTVEADFSYDKFTSTEHLTQFVDDVADHLYGLDGEDISISLNRDKAELSVSLLISSHEYESIETVVGKAMGMMRTAFHACNAATPHWPTIGQDFLSVHVRPAIVVGDADNSDAVARLLTPA